MAFCVGTFAHGEDMLFRAIPQKLQENWGPCGPTFSIWACLPQNPVVEKVIFPTQMAILVHYVWTNLIPSQPNPGGWLRGMGFATLFIIQSSWMTMT